MVAPLAMMGLSIASNLVSGVANAVAGAGSSTAATDKSGIRKTADDFETMFLEQSLDRLTQSAGEEGPLGANGTGGDVYRSMFTGAIAKQVVKSGGVGISDQIYGQMLKLQEGSNGSS